MNASTTVPAAPAAGTTAPTSAPAKDTGAAGFGEALSLILAGDPSTAADGKPSPAGPGSQQTNCPDTASVPALADPASATQAVPATLQLPLNPAAVPAGAQAPERATTDASPVSAAAPAGTPTPGLQRNPLTDAPLPAPAPAPAPQPAAPRNVVPAEAGATAPGTPLTTEPRTAPKQKEPVSADAPVPAPAAAPAPAPVTAATTPSAAAAAPGTGPEPHVVQIASLPKSPAIAGSAGWTPGGAVALTRAPVPVTVPSAAPNRAGIALDPVTPGSQQAPSGAQAAVPAPSADPTYLMGAPTLAAVPAAAPAGPAAPAPPVPVPPGFAGQLARPVFTLASAGTGSHTMMVAVHPDNLGPVTVQAHISAAGVRVELFAANAEGREVLRQILPDLKRDLTGAGLNASLDLSSDNQPGGGQNTREQFFNRRAAIPLPGSTDNRQLPANSQAYRASGLYVADGSLDVMA